MNNLQGERWVSNKSFVSYCILKLSQALSVDNLFYIILNINHISLQKKLLIFSVGPSRVRMLLTPWNPSAEGTLTWESEGGSSQSPPVSPRTSCLWHPQVSDTPHPTNTPIPGIADWNSALWPFQRELNKWILELKRKTSPSFQPAWIGSCFPQSPRRWCSDFSWCHYSVRYCSSHLLKHFQHKLIFSHVSPLVFHYTTQNFSFKKMPLTHQNRNDAFEFLFHQITDYFVIEILNWFPLQRQEITLRWKQL